MTIILKNNTTGEWFAGFCYNPHGPAAKMWTPNKDDALTFTTEQLAVLEKRTTGAAFLRTVEQVTI